MTITMVYQAYVLSFGDDDSGQPWHASIGPPACWTRAVGAVEAGALAALCLRISRFFLHSIPQACAFSRLGAFYSSAPQGAVWCQCFPRVSADSKFLRKLFRLSKKTFALAFDYTFFPHDGSRYKKYLGSCSSGMRRMCPAHRTRYRCNHRCLAC